MERCLCAFSVASPAGLAAGALGARFRRFVVLLLIGILISSKFSKVSALPSHSETNGDVHTSNSRSIVDNNSSEAGVSPTKHIDFQTVPRHHRYHERFHPSSYVRSTLLRRQQHQHQPQQQKGRKGPDHYVNLRKLSSDFGCLANATMCLTVPGWTTASNSSTCCSNGLCTDIQFDGLNCGACENPCKFGFICCSGVCVASASDPQNCGRCANVCKGGVCGFGFCGY